MEQRFTEFRKKEIIDVENGLRIGYADDLLFESSPASVCALVVFGRRRLFGLFGREEALQIPWEDIEKIGEDTILVHTAYRAPRHAAKTRFFDNLFG